MAEEVNGYEVIARIAHQANKAYCETIGDFSQPNWEDAPEWQRHSAIAGVETLVEGKGKATPEEMHEYWMDDKLESGWTYGPEKDPEKKTHPCLVPYDQLPAAQRVKDSLFIAVFRALFKCEA